MTSMIFELIYCTILYYMTPETVLLQIPRPRARPVLIISLRIISMTKTTKTRRVASGDDGVAEARCVRPFKYIHI